MVRSFDPDMSTVFCGWKSKSFIGCSYVQVLGKKQGESWDSHTSETEIHRNRERGGAINN